MGHCLPKSWAAGLLKAQPNPPPPPLQASGLLDTVPMYQITVRGDRSDIEKAGNALSDMDPTPALAVDMKEDGRTTWRLDVYADDVESALGCAGVIELLIPVVDARVEELEDRDWVTQSLEGLPPVSTGRFIVAGSHAIAASAPGKTAVMIEAGPAFGTGHHGTTLGCLEALDQVMRRGRIGKVLDLGTGTGVLAVAACVAAVAPAVALSSTLLNPARTSK